ncbi:GIY-YIG nuclease family protein [Candidatus Parcubacteria bacterium]|nr:MAG: GIY-YIG nuclease family protein [Candidatus Parcubacteria bacterium]
MCYVYILFSEVDKQLYTGFTDNLRSRFKAHTEGYVKATKHRRPLKLIYYDAYVSESDVKRREKYLKGGNGRGELKIQIQLKDILTEDNKATYDLTVGDLSMEG